jgi:hypothetical protein
MAATYLKELRRFSGCADCRFLVAPTNSLPAARSIFRGFANVEVVDLAADLETKIYNEQYLRDFDAWIDLIRFPSLKRWNPETFAVLAPKLGEYLERLERFNKEREKLTLAWPNVDYIKVAFSLANGQNRRSQPDFDKTLEMSDATRTFMTVDEAAFGVLAKNGLDGRRYLTLQRGVDATYQGAANTRMWPKPYYERLIATIKANFPELTIVQLGKPDDASNLTGVDVDLRGRTTFEELKALLKNSALHLDGECGMVHFAHSLNSRCAVFFAQTNVDFCGYPENINVKVDGVCPISCEWIVDDWQDRCPRGFEAPPCMTRLTPEFFFDAIRPTLREIVERPKFVWERVDEAAAQTIANVGDSDGKNAETATLFLGEFDRETLLEARREGKRVFWFALRTTPKEIVEAREAGIDADWADATNVPLRSESCDRVFCDVEEPSECVRREILRIAKIGGTARFGKNGGVWRKRVVAKDETSEN